MMILGVEYYNCSNNERLHEMPQAALPLAGGDWSATALASPIGQAVVAEPSRFWGSLRGDAAVGTGESAHASDRGLGAGAGHLRTTAGHTPMAVQAREGRHGRSRLAQGKRQGLPTTAPDGSTAPKSPRVARALPAAATAQPS